MTIELRQPIESETVTIPELRPFIGRNVRVRLVVDDGEDDDANDRIARAAAEYRNPPGLEELIARQGVKPATEESLRGSLTAEDFEGFDEFLAEIRKTPLRDEP